MSEENKALFREFIDGMNSRDIGFIDRVVAPDFLDHNKPPGQAEGVQGMKDAMATFFQGFPDLKLTVNQLVAEGDIVAACMTTEGTQTGVFMGIPASDKKISITEMHMVRVADGKVVEHWGLADAMTMMQQLGVMPND